MTKEEIIKKQNKLDEEIKKIWGTAGSLDGITDIDTYLRNGMKTLWILKETNRDKLPKENFNQREFNKIGSGWATATYTNIMKTMMGLIEYSDSDGSIQLYANELPKLEIEPGNRDFKFYQSTARGEQVFPMDELALININKGIGTKITNDDFIAAQYEKTEIKKLILSQVEYIDPEVIIVCNGVEKLLCDLADVQSVSEYQIGSEGVKYIEKDGRLIISTGHPAFKSEEKYCNSIFDIAYTKSARV